MQWYLARIERYNGIYRAIEYVDGPGALKIAAREDAEARAGGSDFKPAPMWGVPIVIKANTSVQGLVTSDGWKGYRIPGHELVAPADATVVRKLKAAGAVIIGQTNMPDFAASDTNRSSAFGRTGNAYDVRFSPGGSSGGTVTAVTANLAMLGTGTDTGNSIRMPSATSAVVGVFPTRGLVSIAGIAPLDWLLDNTGPIARTVTDAAIALNVMAGADPLDPPNGRCRREGAAGSCTSPYLKADALKGKRFGVPAFIMRGTGVPFHGAASPPSAQAAAQRRRDEEVPLQPETRDAFMKAIEGLRAAGATVIFDDSILPDSFADIAGGIYTRPYIAEGTEAFLQRFGPAQYHSAAEYQKVVGSALPPVSHGRRRIRRRWRATDRRGPTDARNGPGGRSQLPRTAAKGARCLQRSLRAAAPRRPRLPCHPDAPARRNDAAGRPLEQRSAQRHQLGEHDRRAGRSGPGWLLRHGAAVRARDLPRARGRTAISWAMPMPTSRRRDIVVRLSSSRRVCCRRKRRSDEAEDVREMEFSRRDVLGTAPVRRRSRALSSR